MKVEWAVLADYARSNLALGTIDIIGGGVSRIDATSFPHVIATIACALWLQLDPKELDTTLDFKIEIVDSAGKTITDPATMQMTIGRNPQEPNGPLTLPFSFFYSNLSFPRVGRYEFRFLVGGHVATTLPLLVRAQAQAMALA